VRDVIAQYPGVDVATIPRHVAAARVTVQMTLSTVQEFRTQDPETAAKATPAQRKNTDFLVVAEVAHANGVRRVFARGMDIYGFTAVMMATAVERMERNFTRIGVLSPSEAFDSADFLQALAQHQLHVRGE